MPEGEDDGTPSSFHVPSHVQSPSSYGRNHAIAIGLLVKGEEKWDGDGKADVDPAVLREQVPLKEGAAVGRKEGGEPNVTFAGSGDKGQTGGGEGATKGSGQGLSRRAGGAGGRPLGLTLWEASSHALEGTLNHIRVQPLAAPAVLFLLRRYFVSFAFVLAHALSLAFVIYAALERAHTRPLVARALSFLLVSTDGLSR